MPQSLLLSHPAFTSAPTAQPLRGLLLRAGTCDPQRLILPCWSLIAFPAGPMESHKCLGVPGSWLAAWGTKPSPLVFRQLTPRSPLRPSAACRGGPRPGWPLESHPCWASFQSPSCPPRPVASSAGASPLVSPAHESVPQSLLLGLPPRSYSCPFSRSSSPALVCRQVYM